MYKSSFYKKVIIKKRECDSMLERDFKNIIANIKNEIRNTQYEIFRTANKKMLELYFNVGKFISENSEWGNKFIDDLAAELKIEFPNIKGFSIRNLKKYEEVLFRM